MPEFVTRFAPSPTGYLHLGHAYSAMCAFDAAERAGGRFLLRIEDIDRGRCRPEFEEAIYEDLAWLGLEWETPVRRQSDHFADYGDALQRLIDKGAVYRCFKTRKEILDEIARAPHLLADGPDGPVFVGARLDPEEERSLLAEGAPFAWRLSMAAARNIPGVVFGDLSFIEESLGGDARRMIRADPGMFGDAVIARKDAGTSYHLASVCDDALQGVTHVVRGEDLRAAAHLHALLQALLGLPSPIYRHHALISGDDGKRLAKRDHARTLRSIRAGGATADDVRRRLGFTA
ncbi:MAG: tRNA glutamyl-Q(34) synthetase GluQRS [Alphaproteobacteria bacterium RIFCSPHIGHO2_12_FULL_63_12]|nr:MAG: tRNA glutamyl-Q(34) synthetase GluQRS [Alphaproteobacteria bacterium RIFCSPHIGHO2_12_FULL_63_12]